MQISWRTLRFSLSALSLVMASPAEADSFDLCRRAKTAAEKVDSCSIVIAESNQRSQLERAYLRRGNALMELKRFPEAVRDFTALIQLNPKIAGYYDNRLYALKETGELQRALDDAQRVVKIAPQAAFAYRSRAVIFDALDQYGQSVADFTRALALNPGDVGLLIDRGKTQIKAGRTDAAMSDFNAALELNPSSTGALRERGLLFKKQRNFDAALADLNVVARLDPDDQEVARALQEMRGTEPRARQAPPRQSARDPKDENDAPSPRKGGESFGSGFYVSMDGHLVTNAHVIEGCANVQVVSGLSAPTPGRLLAKDTANDLALLITSQKPQHIATLRGGVKIGEGIAAFGYPLVGLLSTSGNFTVGNVSSVTGMGDDTRYLQISAPIQPGNSGGPVVDQSGNVVGVVVSKLDVIKVAAAIDDLPQNVNFAIKSTVLLNFLDSNGVSYSTGALQQSLPPAELAERSKSFSVLVKCLK